MKRKWGRRLVPPSYFLRVMTVPAGRALSPHLVPTRRRFGPSDLLHQARLPSGPASGYRKERDSRQLLDTPLPGADPSPDESSPAYPPYGQGPNVSPCPMWAATAGSGSSSVFFPLWQTSTLF